MTLNDNLRSRKLFKGNYPQMMLKRARISASLKEIWNDELVNAIRILHRKQKCDGSAQAQSKIPEISLDSSVIRKLSRLIIVITEHVDDISYYLLDRKWKVQGLCAHAQ